MRPQPATPLAGAPPVLETRRLAPPPRHAPPSLQHWDTTGSPSNAASLISGDGVGPSPTDRHNPKAPTPPPPPPPPSDEGAAAWARRAAALSLLGLTGAVAASTVNDLSVFLSCSSQAMEKATQNKQGASAMGEPITRGPWYSTSIVINRAKRSVSCTFPVSGPEGDGLLKFKVVRLGGVYRLTT
ncbi:BEN domain-containing protein 4-like [Hordeum vulgare subsp. vulgare]|uniref:BEN domain-containing protein 4-like n=1 Tax=Hordeum vulgare subsp. vulgare TaxID=112509 RepID=UPI001D1A404A|nr:BEN domain-containing protein 4-like [Hordeum vulgare subsp. vulgare]